MQKEAYYFSHDTNAFNDPKIRILVGELGLWAYGAFWLVIELLAQQRGLRLEEKRLELVLMASTPNISTFVRNPTEEDYANFIKKAIEIGLLSSDGNAIWSEALVRRMERRIAISAERSVAGKLGASIRWNSGMANAIWQNSKNSKGKESKGKEITNTGDASVKAFEYVWGMYPDKDGRKEAFKHWVASVKTPEDVKSIIQALKNYLQTDKVKRGFIKKGATWFNNWQDWIDFKGVGVEDEGKRMLPIPEEQ